MFLGFFNQTKLDGNGAIFYRSPGMEMIYAVVSTLETFSSPFYFGQHDDRPIFAGVWVSVAVFSYAVDCHCHPHICGYTTTMHWRVTLLFVTTPSDLAAGILLLTITESDTSKQLDLL